MAYIGYPEYPYLNAAYPGVGALAGPNALYPVAGAVAGFPAAYPYRNPFVESFISPYNYPGLYDTCCRVCSPRRSNCCCQKKQCCGQKQQCCGQRQQCPCPPKRNKIKIIIQCSKCQQNPCTCEQQKVKPKKKNQQTAAQA